MTIRTPLNTVGPGMHPLNYGARIAKLAIDIQHSIAVDDVDSTRIRLVALDEEIRKLRALIAELDG